MLQQINRITSLITYHLAAVAVFRLQGNLPFKPKPKKPDDGGTLLMLLSGDNGGCISLINILSDLDIGTGMGPGTGGPVCSKGDAG
jgi:hypothetical protein